MQSLKLKTKILIVLSFFFIMLLSLTILSYRYIHLFVDDTRAIMNDNYNSIAYIEVMLGYLNQIHDAHLESLLTEKNKEDKTFKPSSDYEKAILFFETNLRATLNNVTEKGEEELIRNVEKDFMAYILTFRKTYNKVVQEDSTQKIKSLQKALFLPFNKLKTQIAQLHKLNMQAIAQKHRALQDNANSITFTLGSIGLISLLITAFFIFTLPGFFADPIIEINDKLKEISVDKYGEDLKLKNTSHFEFDETTQAINLLIAKLRHYEKSKLSEIWHEKKRTEAILQILKDTLITRKAILILDNHKTILHINHLASELLEIEEKDLLGRHISGITSKNELLNSLINEVMISSLEKEIFKELITARFKGEDLAYKKSILDIKTPKDEYGEPDLIGYAIVLEKA